MELYSALAELADAAPTLRRGGYVELSLDQNCFGKSPLCTGKIRDQSDGQSVAKVAKVGLLPFLANRITSSPHPVFDAPDTFRAVVVTSCVHNVYENTHIAILMDLRISVGEDVPLLRALRDFRAAAAGGARRGSGSESATPSAPPSAKDASLAARVKNVIDFYETPGKLILKVKVDTKQPIRTFGQGKKFARFVLRDATGAIDAVAFTDCCDMVFSALQVGKTYLLANIKGKEKKAAFKVQGESEHEIVFSPSSVITPVPVE